MAEKKLFTYRGAVKKFDTIVSRDWVGQTYAVSAKQASANLAFQYKKNNGLANTAKISLCGLPKLAS